MSVRFLVRLLLSAVVLSLLVACGGGSDDTSAVGDTAGGGGVDSVSGTDSVGTPGDIVGGDTGGGDDVGGPRTDTGPAPDVQDEDVPAPDVPVGTGEFGAACVDGAECASGVCWATSVSEGCTVACDTDADCAEWGAQCRILAPGVQGCGAPSMTGNPTCTDHRDCVWPYICRDDLGGCELPECRFDADCPAEKRCDARLRRCLNRTCSGTIECPFPGEFCLQGACGPPQCRESIACPAGQACFATDGTCRTAPACDENGECAFYNEMCVDDLCVPNPCAAECTDPTATCDPATGRCHRPCGTTNDCPPGEVCDPTRGRCYEDHPPIAVASVLYEDMLQPVGAGTVGAITLDGSLSVDPDGTPLTYEWRLIDVPPDSYQVPGQALPPGRQTTLEASAGRYAVGLVVVDGAGTPSYPAVVVVWVEP